MGCRFGWLVRIDVNVSGKAREIDMGRVSIEGSRPTSIESPLPVEVAPDGALSVYARPGTHRVTLGAVIPEEVSEIAVPELGADFYDPQEVWVWIPDNTIRATEITGLHTIDPARTSLPEDWHGHSTFLGEALETLQFEVTQRGSVTAPNALILNRHIWFDIENEGLSMRDRFSGIMQRDWRLNYVGLAELGRVYQENGEDMLITEDPRSGQSGTEIRNSSINITADLRLHSANPPPSTT